MFAKKNSTNPLAHSKRGVSTIISTIVITGTLLIVLVVASFVSANVLDLQIANTEFEQAKTNMLTLDEVIQDVALRRGSGGYVQFNQRSGGIGINITTQKLTVYGPPAQTSATNSPSSATPLSGNWTNPSNAYYSDGAYAYTSSEGLTQRYGNYSFDLPVGTNITKVQIGYEAFATKGGSLNITCSWDNGSTWASPQTSSLGTNDPNTVTWFDFTNATLWTIDKLSNASFVTRVRPVKLGGGSIVNLDWLPVIVTYYPPLSPIYESSSLVGILYRGGSKVSGTNLDLRGTNSLIVNMSESLGYVRVAVDNGLKIKLDYYRIKIATNSTLMISGEFYNVTQITFINIINGPMGGTDVINFKVQNIDVNTFTCEYESNNVTIYTQLGNGPQVPIRLYSAPPTNMSLPMSTAIIFTEVKIQVSTT